MKLLMALREYGCWMAETMTKIDKNVNSTQTIYIEGGDASLSAHQML